jgi:hypothetical protein
VDNDPDGEFGRQPGIRLFPAENFPMIGTTINVRDNATPKIRALMDRLGPTLRSRLNRNIGRSLQNLCRHHLIGIAGSRHATASRLGATPTGFYGYAAEQIAQPGALSADANGATLTFTHPGMARVGHDVTITAGTQTPGVTLLTIAIDSEAYGHRISQGMSPRFPGGFWFRSKKGNMIYAIREGKELRPLYLGLPSVTQKQDRSLLPSDAKILKTATDTLGDELSEVAAAAGDEINRRTAS